MELTSLISRFFSKLDRTVKFDIFCDDGLDFSTTKKQLNQIKSGLANEWITAQFVALKMLEEQGDVTSFPDGFIMPSSTAVRLDNELRILLELPEIWNGTIDADIKGKASLPTFSIDLAVSTSQGRQTLNYVINGPYIKFGKETQYLLTPEQLLVFEAREIHSKSSKTEYDNLLFLNSLQIAQQKGCGLKLKHFDKLRILTPNSVSIEAELNERGDLVLTPNMGQSASNEAVNRVLGQLNHDSAITLKVGDEIVLFSKEKLEAVKEIICNRVVPRNKVKHFLSNPTAFIDASLVDLDLGFSMRVHGVTAFKHAYFGETDESGIDWFGSTLASNVIYPITKLSDVIEDKTALLDVTKRLEDAMSTGATVFDYENKSYDICDKNTVSDALKNIEDKITYRVDDTEDYDEVDTNESAETSTKSEIHIVDIDLNDEELSTNSPQVERQIAEVSWTEDLNWGNHKRKPFPHQEIGVRWILGLKYKSQSDEMISGALLADDMGLGKTFMALSAIEHMYQKLDNEGKTKKPSLIVAPLSLLENWKDEVDKTFELSPFKDIVILQSAADLATYRLGGVEIRNQTIVDEDFVPKYSLKVGQNFGSERLDLPGRLVITTYQTLRDYQFSLCLIDWGVVVFDEAQNTKNPNALQTRAAKGLNEVVK